MWSGLRCSSHRALGSRRVAPPPARPFTARSSCSILHIRKGHDRLLVGAPCAEYTEWPRAQLTEELRRRYLPITGSKDVLVSRLLEDDSLCSQISTDKGSSTQQRMALSIREDGVVPPFNKVTKAQIITELRRRGAMVSAKTKIELYEALQEAVRLAKAGDSLPEMASQFETDAEVAGNATASAQNETFAQALNIVSDPTYNPASATVAELRGLLQALKVPVQGRKAELLARVNAYRAAMDSKRPEGEVSMLSGASNSEQGAVMPSAAPGNETGGEGTSMTGTGAQTGATSALVIDAIRNEVMHHLNLHLGLFTETEHSFYGIRTNNRQYSCSSQVNAMNRQRVVEALHARGDSLPATASLADLQQRLMTCLLRERRETDFPGSASTLASRTDGEPGPGVAGQPGSEARAGSSGGTPAEGPALEDADALLTASDSDDGPAPTGVCPRKDMPPFELHSNSHLLLTHATQRLRVAVITGGPSAEASVSLESARTVVDALQTRPHPQQAAGLQASLAQAGFSDVFEEFDKHGISCDVYFIDSRLQTWLVPAALVYSRTPADFEFKLPDTGILLGDAHALAAHLRSAVDIAFPVVHGVFGEDGQLGAALRCAGVPFVGSAPEASGVAFNKVTSRAALLEAGFPTLEQTAFTEEDFVDISGEDCQLSAVGKEKVATWLEETGMEAEDGAVVLKPAEGGSSINVRFAFGMQDALEHARDLLANEDARLVVMEPKVLGAIEFSVSVLQVPSKGVIALPPTTIEIVDLNSDIKDHLRDVEIGLFEQQEGQAIEQSQLLDDELPHNTFASYARKYQPNSEIRTHTPPKLPIKLVQAVRRSAERAFLELGLRDYARFDGWVMLHSEAQHMELLSDYILQEENPPAVPAAAELPLPGFGPLPEEEFLKDGVFDISDEQLERMGPTFNNEPLDDYIYSPLHDRYFTPEQLEHAAFLEAEEMAQAEVLHRVHMRRAEAPPMVLPHDPLASARGDTHNSFEPVTTPSESATQPVHDIVKFEGGIVILSEVNPISGLEQGSLLFMQAAAVGWSHAAVLRHIVAGALQRAVLAPLAPPVEPMARDPETLSQGEDLPGSVLSHFTNTLQEMKDVHGDDWPATWEAEDGGSSCSNAWRQPGDLLRELGSDGTDKPAHIRGPPAKLGKVQQLQQMAASGRATSFEEVEDEQFAQLLDAWDDDEAADGAELQGEGALDDTPPQQPGGAPEGVDSDDGGAASVTERATLQGVSATEIEERDMERLVEDIYQEYRADEDSDDSPSGGVAGLPSLPGLPRDGTAGAGSGMVGHQTHGGQGSMGDLTKDEGSAYQEMGPRIGPSGAPGQRQKVYVICGGDSSERNVSLQSGVSVWLQLKRYHDLEATLYVLAPQWSSMRERRRRQDMLEQRTHFLLNGLSEEELPAGLSLDEIRRPNIDNPPPIEQRIVWAVPHALALRHSVEEVVEACELLALSSSTASHALPRGAVEGCQLRQQMQWELGTLGLEGAGVMFEGPAAPHATALDFETFAFHAQENDAVVYNMIHGVLGEDGQLQQYLAHYGIPFTGSPEASSNICMDKLSTADFIGNMDTEHLFPIPKVEIFLSDLAELCRSPYMADAGLAGMREDLVVHDSAPLVIKPVADGCSTGVMCLQEPEHLLTYAMAVAQEWDEIPAELSPGCTEAIPMPAGICGSFVVEPFIECDSVDMQHVPISELVEHPSYATAANIAHHAFPDLSSSSTDGDHAAESHPPSPAQYLLDAVQQGNQLSTTAEDGFEDLPAEEQGERDSGDGEVVPGPLMHNIACAATVAQLSRQQNSGFVEVTLGVYGAAGEMVAMVPSLTLKNGMVLSLGEKFATGGGVSLTPPPVSIVPEESLQAARIHAEELANRLGLAGFARIDAFLGVEDGTLFVIEINTVPGLSPNNVLFQQALLEDPPIFPGEFCRLQVLIALGQGGGADMSTGDGLAEELAAHFDDDDDMGDDSASDAPDADERASDRRGGQVLDRGRAQTQQDELVSMKQLDWDESFKTSL